MDSNVAGDATPDARDGLRRFVDSLPWCVDFDHALTQLVKLAVGELSLGSFQIYVRNQEEDGYRLRKSSSDDLAQGLGKDAPLIRFFEHSGANSHAIGGRSIDDADSEASSAANVQLKSLGGDAAFAFRAQGKLFALALAAPGSEEKFLGAATIQALEWVVSEFERVAPELLQAEQTSLLGRVSNGVAHDLRSCFVALSTMLQLCGEEEPSLDRIRELLPAARTNLDTAQRIIAQAQSAGRSDVFAKRPVDLARVIGLAADLSEPELRAAGVSTSIDVSDGVVVAGVEVLLVRLLRNLLANAIRVSPRGAVVGIRAVRSAPSGGEPAGATVSVCDEGPGMSGEIPSRLTSRWPFPLPRGAGLGLQICREVAEFHKGGFMVESGKDGGTTVMVSLPLARD